MSAPAFSERKLLFLIAAVQFVNILDFMMVMPLGPDFARALSIPTSALGLVGGSYTASAAVSGMACSLFLDRFDRRSALAVALCGLVLGTAAGGFSTGLPSLLASRVVAGAFGGPATSLAMAIIADVIPPERRGRAMGVVMGAFSAASVLGVPAGLELAELGGWQLPFFAVAGLGAVIAALSIFMMPPLTSHLTARELAPGSAIGGTRTAAGTAELLRRPIVLLALAAVLAAMMGNFALIPNLSTFWLFNRGYPRDDLSLLYMVGGAVSFGTMRLSGWLVDRVGPSRVALGGTILYVTTLTVGFIRPIESVPVMVIFVAFMVTGTFRVVPMQALSSRVPEPRERARFMSLQSAVQHLASAAGAMLASRMLVERADHGLSGMEDVAWFAAALASALPILLWLVELGVKRREGAGLEAPLTARVRAGR